MLESLKKRVYEANMDLVKHGLVLYTWGNVSGIDQKSRLVVIKPSGVDYANMKEEDMVVCDLEGNIIEGRMNPSSDTKTHLELYKHFNDIGGIVHTHSTFATAFAQAGRGILPYGTTHADYFRGEIPCTRVLTEEEVNGDYERNTGKVIVERFECMDHSAVPACLVKNHGPFVWGKTPEEAVYHSVVLEEIARMAVITETVNADVQEADKYLLDKHFNRKHGKNAYYGQDK
ncbi:MAG: L-ribulose-5-phosphate 4-epimerase [Clostridia bacterium]|jgi:L-ribulose-5-phosphate 4-epimerase